MREGGDEILGLSGVCGRGVQGGREGGARGGELCFGGEEKGGGGSKGKRWRWLMC